MKTKIAACLSVVLGIVAVSPCAFAEEPKKEKGYEYKFDDDGLLGKDLGANLPIIKVRPKGGRDRLLRPRASFVQEMLKSVENM